MKTIDKRLLDELLELIRGYQGLALHGEEALIEHCRRMLDKAAEIEAECGICWNGIYEFCCGILMGGGVKEEACNEEVYRALEMLGWRVVNKVRLRAVRNTEETRNAGCQ